MPSQPLELPSGSTGEGIILFAAYAVGMGLIVRVASLTVALTRSTAVGHLRRAGAPTCSTAYW